MDLPSNPPTRWTAREAEGYYELGLHEEALERAETLLEERDLAEWALAIKAECLRSLRRWTEAAAAFEALILRGRKSVAAYAGLGWCQKRAGRLDLARGAMERMLKAHPGEPIGLFNLACYSALSGELDRALVLLETCVRRNPAYRGVAAREEDLAALRTHPFFRKIVSKR